MCVGCKGDVAGFFEALERLAYEAISVGCEDATVKQRRGALRVVAAESEAPPLATGTSPLGADHPLSKAIAEGTMGEMRGRHDELAVNTEEGGASSPTVAEEESAEG